jgi:hydrogenase maturation protease
MPAPYLLFAIGNPSRGDDALAPALLMRLQAWLESQSLSDQFELLEEFQLQVEHVTDMHERKRVIFIDAGMDTPAPFHYYRACESDVPLLYSHAVSPEALLGVYRKFYQAEAPDTFVLCIKGESFELGESLSDTAETNLLAALEFMCSVCLSGDASAR